VSAQIIHNDQLAGFQLWAQHMLQIGEKDIAVGGGFHGHDGHPTGNADRSQYRHRPPVACRNPLIDTFAVSCTSVTPGHFRRDTAFIDEDELRRVDAACLLLPELALRLDSCAVLLGGAE